MRINKIITTSFTVIGVTVVVGLAVQGFEATWNRLAGLEEGSDMDPVDKHFRTAIKN